MTDDRTARDMATVIPPPRPPRGMMIRNLIPRLPERGKIKIGGLGEVRKAESGREYQRPIKYEHFVITTLQRGKDGNFLRDEAMHERFGDAPTTIPVRLLYDDPTVNFPTRYAAYQGRKLWCVGDGHKASRLTKDGTDRLEVGCVCPLADPTIVRKANEIRCKMNGALSVLIEGASGLGGVWTFRTTSYNSIVGLLSTMSFLRMITGGPLANIPLLLRIQQKHAANPVDGSAVTIYVVGLEFDGDVEELHEIGHRVALNRARTHLSVAHIEDEARRALMLAAPDNAPLPGDDENVVKEFYPEQVEGTGNGESSSEPAPQRGNAGLRAAIAGTKTTVIGLASEEDVARARVAMPSRRAGPPTPRPAESPPAQSRDEKGAEDRTDTAQEGRPEPAGDGSGIPSIEDLPAERDPFWSQARLEVKPIYRGKAVNLDATANRLLALVSEARSGSELRMLEADSHRTMAGLRLFDKEVGTDRAKRVIDAITARLAELESPPTTAEEPVGGDG